MDQKSIEDLRNKFEAKESAELKAIWAKNDRDAWSDEAFEAIKTVLISRGEDLPVQANFKSKWPVCPKCGSKNIRGHSSWSSILFFLFLTAVFYFILNKLRRPNLADYETLSVILTISAGLVWVFSLAAAIISLVRFMFFRDKCRDCGHRWR